MGTLIVILTIILMINCIALLGLILIQQGKGGGLVAFGGGVEQAFGTHAATLAQKATATMAVIFLFLVIVIGYIRAKTTRDDSTDQPPPASQSESVPLDNGSSGIPIGEPADALPETPVNIPAPAPEGE